MRRTVGGRARLRLRPLDAGDFVRALRKDLPQVAVAAAEGPGPCGPRPFGQRESSAEWLL